MSIKKKLQEDCHTLLTMSYRDGGVASYNEYNQLLCDLTPELIQYLSSDGLKCLKQRLRRVYDDMPEYDKDL